MLHRMLTRSADALRRRLLRLGVAGMVMVGLLVLGLAGAGLRDGWDFSSSAADAPAPQVREFTLTAQEFDWAIMPGTTVKAWGYNGQVPGPEIRVREGDTVRITLVNALPVGTTIHWHGIDVPPAMDGPAGLNQEVVEPGQDFVYEFTATNPGSRMYHSHADPAIQPALGLYGPMVVEPREPERGYDREYSYMLNEWDLELTPDVATGKAPLGPRDATLRGGELGTDLFLMNGRAHENIPPIALAEGERVLVRLMNMGNLPHAIHTHGHSFRIVATDGNDVPEGMELVKDTVLIGPGERYDLELSGDNPGVWMWHCHMEAHAANGMMSLIAYDGAVPTGPAAEFYSPNGGLAANQHGHTGHAGHDPAADPAATTAPAADPPAAPPAAPAPAPAPEAPADGATAEVALLDDRFNPKTLTVAAGTTVTFVNQGNHFHSVSAYDGSWSSGTLGSGESFSVTLETPGTAKFICRQHGLRGMAGAITVQ
jgi:plastocyanin